MKKYILVFLVIIFNSALSQVAINTIGPLAIQQSKEYDIELIVQNISSNPYNGDLNFDWVVTSIDKIDESFNKSSKKSISLDAYANKKVNIGSYNFDKDKEYLIKAQVTSFVIVGIDPKEYKSAVFYQHINGQPGNTSVFTIDSPSPLEYNFTSDYANNQNIHLTLENIGTNDLKTAVFRYRSVTDNQDELVSANDTSPSQIIPKYFDSWKMKYIYLDEPLKPKDKRQIKLTDSFVFGSVSKRTILVVPYLANGYDISSSGDSTRAYFGSHLAGKYSVGDDSLYITQYKTIKQAINNAYSKGMIPEKDAVRGLGGIEFVLRAGDYKESIYLDKNFPNQSLKNPFSISTYYSDSTKVNILSNDSYALKLSNFNHGSFSQLRFETKKPGNTIDIENSKNFVISKSIIQGYDTSATSPEFAAVHMSGVFDTLNIISCAVNNGSYGVYATGPKSHKPSLIGTSHCFFNGQSNASISFNNHQYPAILHNYITDNRIEILNSKNPVVKSNIIRINNEKSSIKGQAYDSEPYSAIGLFNIQDSAFCLENNVCVKSPSFYGVHIRSNSGNNTYAIINKNSMQSNNIALYAEGVANILYNDNSTDLTSGFSENTASVYFDSDCGKGDIYRSYFNSSGGGYAIKIGKKDFIGQEIRNNYYSTGNDFAEVAGKKFTTITDWEEYFGMPTSVKAENTDPQFGDDCHLVPCSNDASGGYGKCNKVDKVQLKYPDHNADQIPTSVLIEWLHSLGDTATYWLQVSENNQFTGIEGFIDLMSLDNNLAYDNPFVQGTNVSISGLKENQQYFWRVRLMNRTEFSDWSDVFEFETGLVNWVKDNHLNTSESFLIYPNPAGDYIEITLNQPSESFKPSESSDIAIYDVLGDLVYSTEDTALRQAQQPRSRSAGVEIIGHFDYAQCPLRIDISNLPSGVYFVRISDRVEMFVKR